MALEFDGVSSRVVYPNIGNFNVEAKSIVLDFFLPDSSAQPNNDFFSATRNAGSDTFQNFLLQLSSEGGTNNSIRAAHFGEVTGQAYTASNVLVAAKWNRIIWTCSNCASPSISNTKFYINGLQQSVLGGSTGANLGATNGDICIGNRAHLDRGINGRIARFAIVNRVVTEGEVLKFEKGLQASQIFADTDLMLNPNSAYLASWDSVVNDVTTTATQSNVTQVSDPTYGLAALVTPLTRMFQSVHTENPTSVEHHYLSARSLLPKFEHSSTIENDTVVEPIAVLGAFDGSTVDVNLSSITGTSTDPIVSLVPRKFPYRDASQDWLTLQARVNNVFARNSIVFKIAEIDFDQDQSFTPDTKLWWRPVSSSKDDWRLFENNELSAGTLTAFNSAAFIERDIYVADQPGYYFSDIVEDVDNWLENPHIASPSKAEADGSISTLESVADENGRYSGQLKQYAVKISDTAPPTHPALKEKLKILVVSNVHAGEMIAKWTVKGLIDWLVSADSKALSARRNFEVFVVWVNSTGLVLGHPVSSVFVGEHAHKNLNRDWGDFSLEATQKARDWINAELSNSFVFVTDHHNLTWTADDRIFREPTAKSVGFCDAVDSNYSGTVVQQNNTAVSGFTTHYYKSGFGIDGATLEPRRGSNSLSAFQEFGAAVGAAFQDMLEAGLFGHFMESAPHLPSTVSNILSASENGGRSKTVISSMWLS